MQSIVSYLGGIKWMPHSSPEDGLGGMAPSVSPLSYTARLQSSTWQTTLFQWICQFSICAQLNKQKNFGSWINNSKYWLVTNLVTFSVLLQVLPLLDIKPFILLYCHKKQSCLTRHMEPEKKHYIALWSMHTHIAPHLMLVISMFTFSVSHEPILETFLSTLMTTHCLSCGTAMGKNVGVGFTLTNWDRVFYFKFQSINGH